LGRLKGFLDGSKLGMKVDQKLPTFLRKKWKQNENIEMETKFCETETEILLRK
jgi:hypothetical protein